MSCMSNTASPRPTALRQRRSVPEVAASDTSWVYWFLLGLAVAPTWLAIRSGGEAHTVGLFWLYAGAVGVFVVIRRQYFAVLRWRNTFRTFIRDSASAAKEIKSFAHRRWHVHPICIIFCVVFAFAALLLFHRGGLFEYNSRVDLTIAVGFVAIASYICALGLSAVNQMTRLVQHLGRFEVYVTSHPFGVLGVGRVLASVFTETAIVWCLYTASAAACPRSWLLPSMGLAVPAVLFFGVAFVNAQLPLHEAMRRYKKRQVIALETALFAIEPSVGAAISEDRKHQIEHLEKRLNSTIALPEWPFRWPSFLTVIGSAAATLAAPIVSSLLTRFVEVTIKL